MITLTASNPAMDVAVDITGKPVTALKFIINFQDENPNDNNNENNDNHSFFKEDFNVELRIARSAAELANSNSDWKKNAPLARRLEWKRYTLIISKPNTTVNPVEVEVEVCEEWWRDVARSLPASAELPLFCGLYWENGQVLKASYSINLKSALTALVLQTKNRCYENESQGGPRGARGFSHHEDIQVVARGEAKYAIVQWMTGCFLKWRNQPMNTMSADELREAQEKPYKYPGAKSCGVDVSGYIPKYIPDGSSQERAWPNFFEVKTGGGLDKPGDEPGKDKDWEDGYDRELMYFKFQVQVYLACDISGKMEPWKDPDLTDFYGLKCESLKNFKFRSSQLAGESNGATLPCLAVGEWTACIMQEKTETGSTGRPYTLESAKAELPVNIKNILDQIDKNPQVRMES